MSIDRPSSPEGKEEEFKKVIASLLIQNVEAYKATEDGRNKMYEAAAVEKLFDKLVTQAVAKNNSKDSLTSEVLIRKFIAHKLLTSSFEAGIASPNEPRWVMMFSGENPEEANEAFVQDFKNVLDEAQQGVEKIKNMDLAVLIFDRFKSQFGDKKRAIRELIDKSSDQVKALASQYGYSEDEFYQMALENMDSLRS